MIEIYLLTNKLNSKPYVGMTSRQHYGNGILITRAKKKYSPNSFDLDILARTNNKRTADCLERFFISALDCISNGYNLALGGDGGSIHTPDIREKVSKSLLKMHAERPDVRARVSNSLKGRVSPRKGITMSEEQKAKISASCTGKRHSPEALAKMSASQKGRPKSAESKQRMSASAKHRASTEIGLANLKRASLIAASNKKGKK